VPSPILSATRLKPIIQRV